MSIMNILKKLRGRFGDNEPQVFDDNETRDKYLRSLRRERRIQMEQLEKKRLIKKIADFKKNDMRKNLYGFHSENNLLKTSNPINRHKKRKERWL